MKIGSLFSGIGGLEYGLERAGLGSVAWQCEIDPWCRKVLAKHWPEAVRYDDVRSIGRSTLAPVDVICGGFPCTDLSLAAHGVARAGLDGDASGLWWEMLRIVDEMRPRFVVVENVAGPWRDWLPIVRESMHGIGYACMPIRMRAADVGLPHGRHRVFVVAYADGYGKRLGAIYAEACRVAEAIAARSSWDTDSSAAMGSADGVSTRMDGRRRKALGNAVVPQCAEVIGRAIVAAIEVTP